MILCQISDLHIKPERRLAYGVVDTATMLERCVVQINRLPQPPDAVIATGDLVDGGTRGEYSLLRELLSPLTMPVYLMPGNHDERQAMRQVFADHAYCSDTRHSSDRRLSIARSALDTGIPGAGRRHVCGDTSMARRALESLQAAVVHCIILVRNRNGTWTEDRLDSSIKLEQM